MPRHHNGYTKNWWSKCNLRVGWRFYLAAANSAENNAPNSREDYAYYSEKSARINLGTPIFRGD